MTKTLLSLLLEELRRLPRLPRRFQFDAALLESLRRVAEREQRSEDEVAADLLESALAQRGAYEARIQVWESLSPREQEVVALACLGHTNRQIAAQLYLSPATSMLKTAGLEIHLSLTSWIAPTSGSSEYPFPN